MARATRPALLGAAICAALAVVAGCLAFLSDAFRLRDAASLAGFMDLHTPAVTVVTAGTAHLVDPPLYAIAVLVLLRIAYRSRGPHTALVLGVVLVGSGLTTKILKAVIDVPRPSALLTDQVDPGSWPSGHATAALTLLLCSLLVAPAHRRALVGVAGTAAALAIAYSTLIEGWHYPSDTIGGFLVAATWTLLGLAVLGAWPDPPRPEETASPDRRTGRRDAVVLAATLAGFAAAVLGITVFVHRDAAGDFAAGHLSFVVVALAIGLLGASLAAAVAGLLRE